MALHYSDVPDYEWSDEERAAIRKQGRGTKNGWDGRCKLWASWCEKGKRCRSDDEKPWTPVTVPSPKHRPQGFRVADRRGCTCPERAPSRIGLAVRRWVDARRGNGLPAPGHVSEQPAWLFDAFGVLDEELAVIQAALQEAQHAKAKG